MARGLPTVLLYARRVPGLRGLLPETLWSRLPPGGRRLTARWLDRNAYTALGYVSDWLEAFTAEPALDARAYNIVDAVQLARARREVQRAGLVVVLHSATGDDLSVVRLLTGALQARRGTLLVFFGNEYVQLREKVAFARAAGADYIATQLPADAGRWLYEGAPRATVLHAPAALNPRRYAPAADARTIDIGFRGDLHPDFIGDDERNRFLLWCRDHAGARGLRVDIAFERVPADAWARFLNDCHGIVGAESGTYFLDRDGALERAVREHLAAHPGTPLAELRARFFDGARGHVSGKAISSRHFEAAGTRTCQVLLEGRYNDVLEADVHYLAVRRDLAGIDAVLERFADPAEREAIATRAHDHVLSAHTYAHRVRHLLGAMTQTAGAAGAPLRAGNPA